MLRTVVATIGVSIGLSCEAVADDIEFDTPDRVVDALVEQCLETDGVTYFDDSKTICYNSAIFPEQFLKLNDLPSADRIIITSPGGNVATARLMSKILDDRGEPAVIAGACMSACAMVLLPGLDSVHIHRSAHIAVHGITMMDYRTWWGWLREDGEKPSQFDLMRAQLGYDFSYTMHRSGKDQMEAHLEGQKVDVNYIQMISDAMYNSALGEPCRVDPKDYWGMLDATHLTTYLSDRITRMEPFAQSWSDPNNQYYTDITKPISELTYIFEDDFEDAACPD
ncbi:MAG: hypothetical protein AAGI14_02115 [Pseudomonadota bacterium]